MRRRILLLVAATTSAVVLAFVIPLCLLVRTLAADRVVAEADQEARNVAVLVSSLSGSDRLADAVASAGERSVAGTTVTLADGTRLAGSSPAPPLPAAELRRAREGSAFTQRTGGGTRVVVPVVTAQGTEVIDTWVSTQNMRQGVARAWLLIAMLGVALMALALVIADQLGRRVSTPVIRVAGIANRLREGDLTARAEPEGPHETHALATALNGLAERIEELLLLERTTVGDLSHRLRTPVTALRLDVEQVADEDLAERLRQHVGNLQRSVDAIVNDARRPVRHGMAASCDATAVVRTAVEFWAPLAEDQGRVLDVDLPSTRLVVDIDAVDLGDVVDILVDNVFAHTPDGSPFDVSLRPGPATVSTPHSGAVLEVVDHLPAAGEEPALPPNAATAGAGGSGLGLTIARRAVASRGGELHIEITSAGTQVTVSLPGPG